MPTTIRFVNLKTETEELVTCVYCGHPPFSSHRGEDMTKVVQTCLSNNLSEEIVSEGLVGGCFDGAICQTDVRYYLFMKNLYNSYHSKRSHSKNLCKCH